MCMRERMRGCGWDKSKCTFISSVLEGAKGSTWKPRTNQWPPMADQWPTSDDTIVSSISPSPSFSPTLPGPLLPPLLALGDGPADLWEGAPLNLCWVGPRWNMPLTPGRRRRRKEQWGSLQVFPLHFPGSRAEPDPRETRTHILLLRWTQKMTLSCPMWHPRLEVLVEKNQGACSR